MYNYAFLVSGQPNRRLVERLEKMNLQSRLEALWASGRVVVSSYHPADGWDEAYWYASSREAASGSLHAAFTRASDVALFLDDVEDELLEDILQRLDRTLTEAGV